MGFVVLFVPPFFSLPAKAFCCWNPNAGVPSVRLHELPALCLSHTHTWWMLPLSFLLGKQEIFLLCLNQTSKVLEKQKGIILRCAKKSRSSQQSRETPDISVISTGIASLWLPQFHVASLIGYLPRYRQGSLKLLGIIILNPSFQCFSDIPELLNKLSFMCSSDKESGYLWYNFQHHPFFAALVSWSLQYWAVLALDVPASKQL